MSSSIQTPQRMDVEYPETPMSQEELDMLLADEQKQDQQKQDQQEETHMIVEVTVNSDQGQDQEELVMPHGGAPSSSPSSSPSPGEPSKNSHSGPPGLEPTPIVSRPVSPETPAVVENNFFDWNEDVHITEVIDVELDWQDRERKYLQEIKELRAFREQVVRVVQGTYSAQQAHGSTTGQDGAATTDLGEDRGQVVGQPEAVRQGHRAQRKGRRGEPASTRDSSSEFLRPTSTNLPPPVKRKKSNSERDLVLQNSNSVATQPKRSPELRSIFRIYSKAESTAYCKGISVLLTQAKELLSQYNPEIVAKLNEGSDRTKFHILQHIAKHLNKMRDEDQLLAFLRTRNLLSLPSHYEDSTNFPPIPNILPGNRASTLNIHNFTYNAKQDLYMRNRLVKLVLSVAHPKLASTIMTLQGDKANMDLLKILFSKQSNVYLQIFHYHLLLQITASYDLSRGRTFLTNSEPDVYLPSNVTTIQFEQKVFQTRQVAWTRPEFQKNFHSVKVASPMKDMDNLHIQELLYIKSVLANPRPHLF